MELFKDMYSRRLRLNRLLMRLRLVIRNDQLILSILAVLVGVITGIGVIFIRESIDFVQGIFLGGSSDKLIDSLLILPWWRILLVPTLGGLWWDYLFII